MNSGRLTKVIGAVRNYERRLEAMVEQRIEIDPIKCDLNL